MSVNDQLRQPLLALDTRGIERADPQEQPSLTRTTTSWGYEGVAKILNHGNRVVAVGAVEIEFDQPLPGDIQDGEMVRFTCERLDALG